MAYWYRTRSANVSARVETLGAASGRTDAGNGLTIKDPASKRRRPINRWPLAVRELDFFIDAISVRDLYPNSRVLNWCRYDFFGDDRSTRLSRRPRFRAEQACSAQERR